MKRAGAIVAALSLMLAWAPGASAQAGTNASLGGVTNNQTVSGYVNLVAKGSATTGVKRLEIQQNGVPIRSENYGGVQTNVTLNYTWDTRHLANAAHTLRARAVSNSDGTGTAEVRVVVNNPASSPTGVSASYSGSSVVVSWNANPEPDIQSYVVERDSGGGWSSVGSTSSTSLSDTPGAGGHSYRVIAVRNSAVSGSVPSTPSGGASVTVPQSAGSGGGGGGSGGGTGGKAGSGKSGSGGGVPGYGGGSKGSKKKGGGKAGSGGGSVYGGFGFASGRRLGALGLPGRLRLPGRAGSARAELSQLDASGQPIEWGEFQETLPYNLPDGVEVTEEIPGAMSRIAAVSPWRVIPPDGLRWVAAGLWLIVTSLLLVTLERRLARREAEEAAEPSPAVLPAIAAVDVVALNLAAHADAELRFVDVVAENLMAHADSELRFVDVVASNMEPAEPLVLATAEPVAGSVHAPVEASALAPAEAVAAAALAPPAGPRLVTGTRTQTVKKTARKKTAAQRTRGAARKASTGTAAKKDPGAPRSAKTTTARKRSATGTRRSGAKKTSASARLGQTKGAAAA